jgi:hypothetical protein
VLQSVAVNVCTEPCNGLEVTVAGERLSVSSGLLDAKLHEPSDAVILMMRSVSATQAQPSGPGTIYEALLAAFCSTSVSVGGRVERSSLVTAVHRVTSRKDGALGSVGLNSGSTPQAEKVVGLVR